MKVAFYAPLKPVDHPVPSGDRQLGQALMQALRAAGHDAFVASKFRSFEGRGDARRQTRLADLGRRLAGRLARRLELPAERPDVWFTYHLYHKAPDWLGPAISRALDIPYVIAEASVAAKQRHGKWAMGYRESVAAVEAAAATIFFNPVDLEGVRNLRGPARADEYVPPFLDLARFASERVSGHTPPSFTPQSDSGVSPESGGAAVEDRGRRLRLITVAMMRPGAKLASYRLLADALAQLASLDWELVIVGDGPARSEVEAAFARFDRQQVRLAGFQDTAQVAAWLTSSDIFVWPAIDEAFGMVFIEAQACGLPVVAGDGGGVGSVIAADRTGVLVPIGNAAAFAEATRRLMTDAERRRRMSAAAIAYAKARHGLPAAAARIDAVLRRVVAEHSPIARASPAPPTTR